MVLAKNTEDFPRSERPEREVKKVNKGFVKRQSEQLFKRKNVKDTSTSRDNEKKRKRKKSDVNNNNNTNKKKKTNEKDAEAGAIKNKGNDVVIEFMDISKLPEGVLVYGCIDEIDDFELRLCVTGGIGVKVPITNISTPYTKLIERFASGSTESEDTELAKLDTMFQIGDYYAVKIISKSATTHFGHTDVIGSINPADIYEGFNVKTFNNLPEGYPLIGSVSAVEDYGYAIDFGVENVKAFLSFDENKKSNNNVKLNIGQLVRCTVLRADDRSIMVTNNKKKIGTVLDFESQISILNFIPGTKTQVTVTKIQKAGLELSLPGEYKGFVPQHHISENLSSSDSVELNETYTGTVLYVQPFTKQICISLKENLSKKVIKNFQNVFHFGMIIKNAVVCGRGMMGSVIFRVNSNHYAYCRRKNLAEASELEGMDIDKRFKVGSSHLAKVKSFNLFDNLVEISLKKSFIEKETLDIHQLSVCQKVDCTVKQHDPKGMFVKLGPGIDGFVPLKHLTDAPFKNMNMEKMFPLKSTVKCRIMKMIINSKAPRISLTMKKSLLNLPEEEIFTNFEDIQPGMTSTGVVCLIQQQGILVEFFGSVAAFIPLKNLATYKIEYPEKVFTVGQLVKVTVVVVHPERKRMIGSLIDIKLNKKSADQSRVDNHKLAVGQILKKMKVSEKVKTDGLDLVNLEGTVKVFVPVGHLSDDPYLSQLIFMSLKTGDVIDEVMVFNKDLTNTVLCTKKPVFIDYALSEDKKLVKCEDDIELKVPFPAIIRNVTENGVFFEIPGGNCGVLRKKFFQDAFYDEPEKLGLKKNQTIFIAAIEESPGATEETDPKKAQQLKKYKFSMRLSDVWNKADVCKTEFMKNYILNQEWIKQMLATNTDQKQTVVAGMKKLVHYSVGSIVKYTITKINDTNFELKIGTGKSTTLGFALKWNSDFNDFNVDQVGEAIVCDYDFENNALRVFIPQPKSNTLKHVKAQDAKNAASKVKVDQVIKGTILSVCNRYLLVCLGGHVPGAIAFVPTRRHYNDCGEIEALFSVGSEHHFKITQVVNDEKIVGVVSVEAKSQANKTEKKLKKGKLTEQEKKEKIEARRAEKKARKALLRNERRLAKLGNLGKEKVKDKVDNKKSADSDEFQWDIPDPTPNLGKKRKLTLDDIPDSDNEHLSSEGEFEDDDDLNDDKNAKKRKTKSELSEERKKREKELRDTENNLSDPKRKLKSEEDFEMAIIGQPNSSLVWLKFMSFYLEKGNVDKARAVADRALEKISFREEKEKLNIWIGLLNLENSYGDQDSMDKVLEKALKYNDPKTIYLQLASIYELSEKPSKAEEVYQTALKKFKQDKSVWIEYLVFLMKSDRIDFARKQFQKSLLSLDKREHVDIISKFAQLEFKFGDSEQAKTIFEQMLATYWKRLDQWSIYIDMLIKYSFNPKDKDSLEYIRNVFERLISFKLSPERMKFVFKKYYDFEQKYNENDTEVLDRIKQKALEYVEKDIF